MDEVLFDFDGVFREDKQMFLTTILAGLLTVLRMEAPHTTPEASILSAGTTLTSFDDDECVYTRVAFVWCTAEGKKRIERRLVDDPCWDAIKACPAYPICYNGEKPWARLLTDQDCTDPEIPAGDCVWASEIEEVTLPCDSEEIDCDCIATGCWDLVFECAGIGGPDCPCGS